MPEEEAQEEYKEDDDPFADLGEEDELDPSEHYRKIKKIMAVVLSVVLFGNLLAFWPQVFNIEALQFLRKSRELSQMEDIQQYKQAVVVVKAGNSKGTGFNIRSEGLIVTNHHVVEGEQAILIHFPSGETLPAEVLAADAEMDLALLGLNADKAESSYPVLEIGSGEDWSEGDALFVIGNPLFFQGIANEGHILGLNRYPHKDQPVMALDAPIYKGNSGSPVLTEEGKAVAVVYATSHIRIDGQQTKAGLAIPSEVLMHLLEEL